MKENVARRIRNTRLTVSKPLLPLYEAVANAIQAVHEAGNEDGRVTITIMREHNLLGNESPELAAITGFIITDNGVGFTKENFASFTTADTDHKAKLGGKGVGRFLWLVAFSHAEIDSYYQENGSFWRRTFNFVKSPEGVANLTISESSATAPLTTVKLIGYDQKYQRRCPKSADTIASYLTEHFLSFFLQPGCPVIELSDPACQLCINLNAQFENRIIHKSERETVHVGEFPVYLLHLRLEHSHTRDHQAHYCADSRVVKSESLRGKIPDLTEKISDHEGRDFIYHVYVESPALDQNLNAERTDFVFADDGDTLLADDIDWKTIRSEVHTRAGDYLKPYTSPVREKKLEKVRTFIAREAPMYRPVLKYAEHVIDNIEPDISDQKLELKLYEAYQTMQIELRSEGSEILRVQCSETDWQAHQARIESYFAKVSDLNMSDLARYVCHRRAMLDFVHQRLSLTEDERYHTEKLVHQLICPMGITSDDIGIESHNLWMLDERLVYHEFLASDKSLKSIGLNNESSKEPDVLILDRAIAFVPGTEEHHDVCHIIEFKRPMRNEYDERENPFTQIRKYIEDIRSGTARTEGGRQLGVHKDARFFCYIVCDLTPKLQEWAELVQLQLAPDGRGYFGYHKSMNAYFEVISYSKMVDDARKRNAAFFDKLGLPSRIRP